MPHDESAIVLGANGYGKSGVRLVRVVRDTPRHELRDLTVDTTLTGDLDATHYRGDNAGVLPTDTQKNTVYAFARDGIGSIESFAARLARHFVDTVPSIGAARVRVEEHPWRRVGEHSFARGEGGELRTAEVEYDGRTVAVAAGVRDLLLLNTTGSAFGGFLADRYTTLQETDDRILATAVNATWTYKAAAGGDRAQEERTDANRTETAGTVGAAPVVVAETHHDALSEAAVLGAADLDAASFDDAFFEGAYATARAALLEAFAETYSLSLQQTLYAIGERILRAVPEIGEVRLSLPNRHHYLYDLERFGLDNPGLVFQAGDLPYGLIEGTVRREAP